MLANGEKFSDAVEAILKQTEASNNLVAVGMNCINPAHVSSLLKSVNSAIPAMKVPFVVYPNSGKFLKI